MWHPQPIQQWAVKLRGIARWLDIMCLLLFSRQRLQSSQHICAWRVSLYIALMACLLPAGYWTFDIRSRCRNGLLKSYGWIICTPLVLFWFWFRFWYTRWSGEILRWNFICYVFKSLHWNWTLTRKVCPNFSFCLNKLFSSIVVL